ncbi:battenin-like [Lingula anatina]|uniref:Battenin n=1 Tax=Lingula anatina TaxID=7574 RepID=A0A1S3IZA7_LINAN|nr:battenin-like [Lingula anatina]|eukprot:XP_013403348.1 battenin-like [Lingula anatina]
MAVDSMILRNWIGLFLMGAINNLPYVVINSAASTIASEYGQTNFVGLVFGANVAAAFVVKSLNTFFLLKVPYAIRIVINGLLMLGGLLGIAFSSSFGMALACIVVAGSSAAFGENVLLGYLSKFPGKLVNAYASGTGMAGLLGAGLFIIFGCVVQNTTKAEDKQDQLKELDRYAFLLTMPVVLIYWMAQYNIGVISRYAFLLTMPVVLIYWVSFFFIVKAPHKHRAERIQRIEKSSVPYKPLVASGSENNIQYPTLLKPDEEADFHYRSSSEHPEDDTTGDGAGHSVTGHQYITSVPVLLPPETRPQRYWRCFKLVIWHSINLSLVYLFEYVARACASKVEAKSAYNVGCPEFYAALQFCYQAGVFASRSSVQIIQIRRVEVLTLLQLVNMVVWLLDVHFKVIPEYLLPAYMIYVGLLGGASYVNIFYLLLHDGKYPDEDREICINIAGLFVTLGITSATGLETALFETILKED